MNIKQRIITWYKNFVRRNNEHVISLIGIVLMIVAMPLIRLLDPTAAGLDLGYLHAIIFSTVCVAWAFGLSWFMVSLSFPKQHRFFDDQLWDAIRSDDPKQVRAAIFSASMWAFYVAIASVILINVI